MLTEEQRKFMEEHFAQGKTDSAVLHGQSPSKSKATPKKSSASKPKAAKSDNKKSK